MSLHGFERIAAITMQFVLRDLGDCLHDGFAKHLHARRARSFLGIGYPVGTIILLGRACDQEKVSSRVSHAVDGMEDGEAVAANRRGQMTRPVKAGGAESPQGECLSSPA